MSVAQATYYQRWWSSSRGSGGICKHPFHNAHDLKYEEGRLTHDCTGAKFTVLPFQVGSYELNTFIIGHHLNIQICLTLQHLSFTHQPSFRFLRLWVCSYAKRRELLTALPGDVRDWNLKLLHATQVLCFTTELQSLGIMLLAQFLQTQNWDFQF